MALRPCNGQRLTLNDGRELEEWTKETVSLWLRSIGVGLVKGLQGLNGSDLVRLTHDDLLLLGVHDPKTQDIILSSRDALLPTFNTADDDDETGDDPAIEDEPYVSPEELRSPAYMLQKTRAASGGSSGHGGDDNRPGAYEDMTPEALCIRNGELRKLLADSSMTQYSRLFVKEGIDDVTTLCEYTTDELKSLGLKGGHAKRLLSQARDLNPKYRTNASRLAFELQESERRLRDHVERLTTVQLAKFRPNGRPWEIDRDTVFEGKLLGEGGFGKVYFGTAAHLLPDEEETLVAIKKLKPNASELDKRDFLDEIHVMQQFDRHENLVNLLGFCVRQEPMMLVLEYMKDGDMLSFLRNNRPTEEDPEPRIKAPELLGYMADVAAGMAYISSRHCVHRDLAARNILLDRPRAAVADFGLARRMTEQYAYLIQNKQRALPTRWLAPESLLYQKFTSQTDVWAFGVTMWEIVMMGAVPYPGIPTTNLFRLLLSGHRMDRPQNCSQDLYNLMLSCWNKLPSKRPTFESLERQLRQLRARATHHLDDTVEGTREYLTLDVTDEDDEWMPQLDALREDHDGDDSATTTCSTGARLERSGAVDHADSRHTSVSQALEQHKQQQAQQGGDTGGVGGGGEGDGQPTLPQQATYVFHMPKLDRTPSAGVKGEAATGLQRQGSGYHRMLRKQDGSFEVAMDAGAGETDTDVYVDVDRDSSHHQPAPQPHAYDDMKPRPKPHAYDDMKPRPKPHAYDDMKPRSKPHAYDDMKPRDITQQQQQQQQRQQQQQPMLYEDVDNGTGTDGNDDDEEPGYDQLEGVNLPVAHFESMYENDGDGTGALAAAITPAPSSNSSNPLPPLPTPPQQSQNAPQPHQPPHEQAALHQPSPYGEPISGDVYGAPLPTSIGAPPPTATTTAATGAAGHQDSADLYITTDDVQVRAEEKSEKRAAVALSNVRTDVALESLDLDAVADAALEPTGADGDDGGDDDPRRFDPSAQPVYIDLDDDDADNNGSGSVSAQPQRPAVEECLYDTVRVMTPSAAKRRSENQGGVAPGWAMGDDGSYMLERPGEPEQHALPKDAGYLEADGATSADEDAETMAIGGAHTDARGVSHTDVHLGDSPAGRGGLKARPQLRRSRREEKPDVIPSAARTVATSPTAKPAAPSPAVASKASTPAVVPQPSQSSPLACNVGETPPAERPPARPALPTRQRVRNTSSSSSATSAHASPRTSAAIPPTPTAAAPPSATPPPRPPHKSQQQQQQQQQQRRSYGRDEAQPYTQLPPSRKAAGARRAVHSAPQPPPHSRHQPGAGDDSGRGGGDDEPLPPLPPKPPKLQNPNLGVPPELQESQDAPPLPKKGGRRR
ncbi:TK protein kinase [Salpingoeca rosetta]|uniref:TK protein kinase n=1 Tax=Salpingoeca rosetta (strain ATCC 50818 / BSB-021) TaxID=946362 RepID=F2UJ30_SALR5|nr:TK protein kinase [Salpingoeca rosetta]EGD76978.1 TK protein kinase [Salpingoeca rosetta]|eukprot:XP_004990818.1 TK protein kinase [Salpingoeca rosetta]